MTEKGFKHAYRQALKQTAWDAFIDANPELDDVLEILEGNDSSLEVWKETNSSLEVLFRVILKLRKILDPGKFAQYERIENLHRSEALSASGALEELMKIPPKSESLFAQFQNRLNVIIEGKATKKQGGS